MPLITTLPVPFGARLISPSLAVAMLADPRVAPLIVGVVKVLFVKVSVVALATIVSVVAGMLMLYYQKMQNVLVLVMRHSVH